MTGPPRGFAAAARAVRVVVAVNLAVAGALFALATVALLVEITLRYGFDTGFPKSHEAVGIAFVYVFLLGAAALYGRNEDIAIDVFYRRLPEPLARWLALFIFLAVAVGMVVVLAYTAEMIHLQGTLKTFLLRISMTVWFWPLAIASASIAFTSLVECWACAIWIKTETRPPVWPEGPNWEDQHFTEGDMT